MTMANGHEGRVEHFANSPLLTLVARVALIVCAAFLAALSYFADKTLKQLDEYGRQLVVIAQSVAVQQMRIENHEKRLDRIEGPRDR